MERSGVWDEDENRCRFDCLLWTQKTGCVQLNDNTLSVLEQCGQDIKCYHSVIEKVMLELCRKYKGKYNPKDNNCNFEAAD